MSLKKIIFSEINKSGPITISRFMEHCLYNDRFGYYSSSNDKIGVSGDFITSPEISQLFGELIGVWLLKTWIDRGRPTSFNLVELGPGNGTLMRDILNAIKKNSDFIKSATVVLVETSKVLKDRQMSLLGNHRPLWVKSISNIPDQPLFLIANEFLDALPIRQFRRERNTWFERSVGISKEGELEFVYIQSSFNKELSFLYRNVPNGVTVETSDFAKNILSNLSGKLLRNGGVSLFIDYGYSEGYGETLQSVKQHKYTDPLKNLGKSDLTAQVNFNNVFRLAQRYGLRPSNLLSQRNFLIGLGIHHRSNILAKTLSNKERKSHIKAIERLTEKKQMGDLFKVIGITNREAPKLPILE